MDRAYWNRMAACYEAEIFSVLEHDRAKLIAAKIARYGDHAQAASDIGCGIGLLAMYLRGAGFDADVTGFDYDTGKIAAAKLMAQRSGFSGLHYAAGDARHEMPAFSGHVVILDILQFFIDGEYILQ